MGRCVSCSQTAATCACVTDATITGFGTSVSRHSVSPDGVAVKWATITETNPVDIDHVLGEHGGQAALFPAIESPAVTAPWWLNEIPAVTVPAADGWVLGADVDGTPRRFLAADPTAMGVAWEDAAILVPEDSGDSLLAVSASGLPLRVSRGRTVGWNGNYGVWQRGAGPWTTTASRTADCHTQALSGATCSQSIVALAPNSIPAVQSTRDRWYAQHVVVAGSTSAHYAVTQWQVDGADTLAGRVVTLSVFVRGSGAANVGLELTQVFGSGGSPSSTVFCGGTVRAVTTGWTRVSLTLTLPSVSGKTFGTAGDDDLVANLWFDAGSDYNSRLSGALGHQSGTFDVFGWQLDEGPVASPWRAPDATENLRGCQRRLFIPSVATEWYGQAYASAAGKLFLPLPVPMRKTPSFVTAAGTFAGGAGTYTNWLDEVGVGTRTPTTLTLSDAAPNHIALVATGATSLPAYAPIQFNSNATLIGASAE